MVARHIPSLVWLALAVGAAVSAQERAQIIGPETAAISGRVVDGVSGRAVPGVHVQVMREPYVPSLPAAVSGADGAFTIRGLPGGQYTFWTSKGGYLPGAHGKRRASGQGTPVQVGEGQHLTDVAIVTWPEASIAGTVVDERGLPVAGVPVIALKRRPWGDTFRYDQSGSYATTNDRGEYRIKDLTAGDYVVAVPATTQSRVVGASRLDWSGPASPGDNPFNRSGYLMDASGRTVLLPNGPGPATPDKEGRPRTYVTSFGGGITPETAQVIRLAAGESRGQVEIGIRIEHAARVSGRIVGPAGPVRGALLSLIPEGWTAPPHLARHIANAAADGSFTFLLVPAGTYSLVAQRRAPPLSDVTIGPSGGLAMPMDDYLMSDEERLWLETSISVDAGGIANLELTLRPGARISATSVFDGASAPSPSALQRATAALRAIESYSSFDFAAGAVLKHEGEGRFTGRARPGRYVIAGTNTGVPGFHLKSVSRGGRELPDGSLEVGTEDVTDLVLTFTDRPAALRGRVSGARDVAVTDATVVVFPTDRSIWELEPVFPGESWRVRNERVRGSSYSIERLDAGEYFVAAVDDALLEEWPSPTLLARLAAIATRVRLGDGEQRILDLQVCTPGRAVQDDSRPHVVQAFRPVTWPAGSPEGVHYATISAITALAARVDAQQPPRDTPANSVLQVRIPGPAVQDDSRPHVVQAFRPVTWPAGSPEGLHYATISAVTAVAANVDAQQPPRDTPPAAATAANSVLYGRVTDATGVPLGRTIVTIAGVQPGGARTANTNDDGRYAIGQLPAGRFIVWATRAGWLPVKYGQDAAGLVESRVVLTGADRVKADFVLTAGAAISGTVVDGNGEPVVNGVVHVQAAVRSAQQRLWDIGRPAVTDDRGAFRLWGLHAGEYLVFAVAPDTRGSSVAPGAVTVRVAAGEEKRDVALVQMPPPATVRVDGTALGPDGLPIRGTRVQLVDAATRSSPSYPAMNPDGSFVFRSVPPGRYVAVAQASIYRPERIGATSDYYWGTTDVQIDGNAPVTTAIAMAPGVKLSGRIVLLSTGKPTDFSRVRVSLSPLDLPDTVLAGSMGGGTARDGTFTITGVPPGRYTIRVELYGMMAEWTVLSAITGNVDALDVPIRIDRNDVAGVNITLTDRPARLIGSVHDDRGEPSAPVVVVYSADATKWLTPSKRWVRAARPDTRGEFEVAGLPPGQYHVALVERLPGNALSDAEFLRTLKPRASVTLTGGDIVEREFVFRSR